MTITITDKAERDPVAEYSIVDAYMRWAMEAVKKLLGEEGLHFVLRNAGLERFITDPPSGEMEVGDVTFGDYAAFNAALLKHLQRPGKSMAMRIGRESAQMAMSFQRALFNVATLTAAKAVPSSVQIKMGLSALMAGFKRLSDQKAGQEFDGTIEEHDDHYDFIVKTCPFCVGKQSDHCIGWLMEATIEESARQAFGKFFDVVEVECKAKGAPAGVWRVPKEPSDESYNQSAR